MLDIPAWRSYLVWYMSALLIACCVVIGVNAIVDPHARLLIVDVAGFNRVKIVLPTNSRRGKANALRQCSYDGIVLGTSRAETGIAVKQPALEDSRIYNAGLRGGTIFEMRRVADYAVAHQKLSVVLLNLDFVAFDAGIITREDFAESPLAESGSVTSDLRYLLSLPTFWGSLFTVRWNMQGIGSVCADNGEHKRTYELSAAREAFDFVLRTYAGDQYMNFKTGDEHYEHLEAMLRMLAANHVQVYAFISPIHVTQLELKSEMGRITDYENWKRRVVQVFDSVNKDAPNDYQAALWDFSGYNEITTERVPLPEESKFMRWYFDSAHFNQDVGQLIIDRILGRTSASEIDTRQFGIALNSGNVDEVIAQAQRDSAVYRREHPEEIARLQKMLRQLN